MRNTAMALEQSHQFDLYLDCHCFHSLKDAKICNWIHNAFVNIKIDKAEILSNFEEKKSNLLTALLGDGGPFIVMLEQ